MFNPGETLPVMVEVAVPAAPAGEPAEVPATVARPDAITITIGKATLTLPSSMLERALRELTR